MEKKDRIRYSEAFKLKVMEELRDGKFKIEEAIRIYNSRRLHEKCGYKTPQAFREEQTKKAA